MVLLEVARQAHPAGHILKERKQLGFTFPMVIGKNDVYFKNSVSAEESFDELATYCLQKHLPRKYFDLAELGKKAYCRHYRGKASIEDYWANCLDDFEVRRREYSRLNVQQMRVSSTAKSRIR